jgi:hypothetical protein
MTLRRVPAFTMIAIVGLGVQAEAQAPCPELVRLRNAASEAWKQAMRVPPAEPLRSALSCLLSHGGDTQLRK